jgi:RHS repeat-associated protein
LCALLLASVSGHEAKAQLRLNGTGKWGNSGSVYVNGFNPATNKWSWIANVGQAQIPQPTNPVTYVTVEGCFDGWDTDGYGNGSGTTSPGAQYLFAVGDVVSYQGTDWGAFQTGFIPLAPVIPAFITIGQKNLDRNTAVEPVQLASGAESRHKSLFKFRGARSWDFILSYNSMLSHVQNLYVPMAMGWSHNFQTSVSVSGSNLIVNWNQSSYNNFTPTVGNPNLYTSAEDGGRYDTIVTQSNGGWLLTHRDQSTLLFNASGQLIVDSDPHGHKLNLVYSGIQLSSVTDPVSNTSLSFSYDGSGCLQTLKDSSGATVQFSNVPQINPQWIFLEQIIDQNGNYYTYAYDSNYYLTAIRNFPGPLVISNTNDALGRVVSQSDGKGQISNFSYSTVNGNATTTYTDRNGKSEVFTFDSNYNELSAIDALNQTTTNTYDSANRVTSSTDPLNRVTSYTYDSQGNVLTVTDPAGKVTTSTYDARNNLLTITDPLGHVTTSTYDVNNNLLTYVDALGRTTTWTYNANSQPITKTLSRGGVYSLTYTAGELTKVTDPNGIITTFGYDADGRALYSQDALGNRTTLTYDAVGNCLTATNPLSQTVTDIYDFRNRITSNTDPAGAGTSFTYDNNNNVLTKTDALSKVTAYTYDPDDRLQTVTDALSRVTTLGYDANGRLINVTDPAGNIVAFQYDAASQLIAITDALGKSTTLSYELRGLISGATDPLNRSTTFTYDNQGRRITSLDPLGRQTNLVYDALNRLVQVTDPGNLATAVSYDNDGDRSSITDPAGNAATFTYDAGDRPTASATPAGRTTSYSYDARGLPLTATQPSTHSVTFAYDNAERLSSFVDPVGTVSVNRDADGRVLTINEGGKILTRAFDALGRLTSYTDGAGNVISYQYDGLGRLTQLTYPGGRQVAYAYDTAGRLSTVTDWASRVTTYSYDADGRPTQLLRPNGTKQMRTYDAAGQLTQLVDYAPNGSTAIYSGSYGFDLAGQLTSAVSNPPTAGITPNVAQTFDQDDRLLTQNGGSVSIDADGNLLSVASGLTPATYTYDARNRLTAAGSLTYGYNSENRRVALTDSTGTTQFAINPNGALDQVLIRTAPNGTATFYVYGLGLLHEDTGGVARYYHFDRRGDTVALTDSTGTVSGTIGYGAYGEILNETGVTSTSFLYSGFWGVQTDSNGLYFHRARYYHPTLRRWLNRDPIGLRGGLNLYGYVGNDPMDYIDPNGKGFAGAIIDGLIGAGSAYIGSRAQGASTKVALEQAVLGGLLGAIIGGLDPSEGLLSAAKVGGLTGLITNQGAQFLTAYNKPGGLFQNFNMNWGSYLVSGAFGALAGAGELALTQDLMMRYGISELAAEIVAGLLWGIDETLVDLSYDLYQEQNKNHCDSGNSGSQ